MGTVEKGSVWGIGFILAAVFVFIALPLIVMVIFCGSLAVLGIGGAATAVNVAEDARSVAPIPTAVIPTYEVVDRNKVDTPIKSEITLDVVVSGTVTESGLRQLLQKLYDEANKTRGYKFHGGKPTHVWIYVYTSREHLKSGYGQWIAMLSKVGEGSRVDIRVKTELIAQLDDKPEIKHGLSETTRKEVFLAIIRAEDRANEEAEERYPLYPTMEQLYPRDRKSQLSRHAELVDQLLEKYKAEVADKYGLTLEQLQDIGLEGLTRNWPMP